MPKCRRHTPDQMIRDYAEGNKLKSAVPAQMSCGGILRLPARLGSLGSPVPGDEGERRGAQNWLNVAIPRMDVRLSRCLSESEQSLLVGDVGADRLPFVRVSLVMSIRHEEVRPPRIGRQHHTRSLLASGRRRRVLTRQHRICPRTGLLRREARHGSLRSLNSAESHLIGSRGVTTYRLEPLRLQAQQPSCSQPSRLSVGLLDSRMRAS